MVEIDIIILSYSQNEELKKLTQQTIDTLFASEDGNEIKFNVIVVESERRMAPYQFPGSTTIYPQEKFGFNTYMNIGIRASKASYVCLCNNDLIFHNKWLTIALNQMHKDSSIDCCSFFCPTAHTKAGFLPNTGNIEGYHNLFSGWCFLIKRILIDAIGYFDEKLTFWYVDNDFLMTLKSRNLKNYLITESIVEHIGFKTTEKISERRRKELTILPLLYYNYKWVDKNWLKYILKNIYFNIKIKLKI